MSRIALLPPESQAGLVLNLRANAIYPPVIIVNTVRGTAAEPIVIQPYDGDQVVFDGGEPRFRQPGAWEPVPGQVDEWRTKDTFTTLPGERVAWGQMMDTRLRLITYATLEDMRATNESFDRVPVSDPRPGHPSGGRPGPQDAVHVHRARRLLRVREPGEDDRPRLFAAVLHAYQCSRASRTTWEAGIPTR